MYSGSGLCHATTGSNRSSRSTSGQTAWWATRPPSSRSRAIVALALGRVEVVEDRPRHQEPRRPRAGVRLDLGERDRRVEGEVDVVAQDEVARPGSRSKPGEPVPARPWPPRAAPGSASARTGSSPRCPAPCASSRRLDLHVDEPRPRPRPARAPRGSCRRSRSRSRAGRRRGAPAGSSRPRRGTCRPARRPGTRAPSRASRRARRGRAVSGPGAAVRKRIASGWRKRGRHELVGQLLAERHAQLHLDQVDADRVPHEVGHLPAGDARGALDDDDAAVRRRRSAAGTRSRSRGRAPARCARRSAPTPRAGRRRPSPGRRGSSRRRSRCPAGRSRSESVSVHASPSRAITIPFISVPSTYSSRIASCVGDAASASCRCASMSSTDSTRKIPRWPPESAGFSTAGKPDLVGGAPPLRELPQRGEPRLRHALPRRAAAASRPCASSGAPSRPRSRAGPRASAIAATTGTARSAETVSTPSIVSPAIALDHRVDVGEVDHEPAVGLGEPERVGVAVDRDHAQAELLGPQDRAPLVAPGADEEDGLHGRAMLVGHRRGLSTAAT